MNPLDHRHNSKPVLLMCSERSGSNLLRCILDSHTRIYAPNTMALGHLCYEYIRNRNRFRGKNWNSMVTEVCRRINSSEFYSGVSVDEAEIYQNVNEDDIGGLYLYPYCKGLKQFGADRIMIKEHQAWRISSFFLNAFSNSKIIIQVRDPRDHVVSCKKLGKLYKSYHGSVPRAAKMWQTDQLGALSIYKRFGNNIVRFYYYEDLVHKPQKVLKDICEFIDIEWQERMLDFHLIEKKRKLRSKQYLHNMWANLDRPLNQSSVGQWKNKLNKFELKVVTTMVKPIINEFGYNIIDQKESYLEKATFLFFSFLAHFRYMVVTTLIWLAWLWTHQDIKVPLNVILGNTVRAHLSYERFRDRIGYRL